MSEGRKDDEEPAEERSAEAPGEGPAPPEEPPEARPDAEEAGEPPEEPSADGEEPASTRRRPARRWLWAAVGALWVALAAVVLLRGPLADTGDGGPEGPPEGAATTGNPAATGSVRVRVRDPDGHPAEGVSVGIEIHLEGGPPAVAHAITDERGRVLLSRLPAGVGRVTVDKAGWERTGHTVPIEEGEATLEVTLRPGGALAGIVMDSEGSPIAGARVTSRPADDDAVAPWEATTGDGGRFSFDTLRPGPQRVDATADGYDTVTLRADTGTDDLRFTLRQTGEIAGVVRGPDGDPAEGATVTLAGSGVWPARQTTTDAAGSFRITGVPGGIYEVRASRGDLVADPREGLSLAPGQQVQLDLRLAPGAALSGVVVSAADEEPVAGAEVVVSEDALSFAPRAARTAEDGTFRIGGLRRQPHRVSVHSAGYVSVTGETHEPGGDPVRIELRKAAVLAGTVVDSRGYAIAGAQVELIGEAESGVPMTLTGAELAFREALFQAQLAGPAPLEPSGELGVTLGPVPPIPAGAAPADLQAPAPAPGAGDQEPQERQEPQQPTAGAATADEGAGGTYVTDAEGRFRLTGVPPGRWQLVGRHVEHASATTDPLLVTAGSVHEDIEIELPDGGTIDGRVVDGRGFPVGHVRVEMHSEREPYPRLTIAAEDGTFHFDNALGTTTLTALPAGRPAAKKTLPVQSGETLEVELALEGELVLLAARTVDERGFPISGARVTVRSLRASTPVQRTTLSADDGTLEIPGLPPPPWRVQADHEDYAAVVLPEVDSVDGELRITLEPGVAVRGQVIGDWNQEPVAGATVTLRGGSQRRAARTDEEGKFELRRVPEGNYEVIAEGESLLPARRRVVLEPSAVGLEDLELEPLRLGVAGSVAGQVVDAVGTPVAGAEVAAGDPPDWGAAVHTDARGHFTLTGVAPGDVSLVARHPAAGGEGSPEPTRVFPEQRTPGVLLRLPDRFDARDVDLGEGRRAGVAVTVRSAGERVRIARVVPRSAAARVGLRRGDVLVSVDDEQVLSVAQARALLRGPDGSEAIVEIERGGRTRRVPVKRESHTPP